MVSQYVWIGIVVLVFIIGIGIGNSVVQSGAPMMPMMMNSQHMMQNQQTTNQWMDAMMSNQESRQQMIGSMMSNQDMMNAMMNSEIIINSQVSQTIPSNQDPQTRIFQISMEEVEFFAEIENENGMKDIALAELHTWEPNLIIVNQGDTVVLEISNPRKNAHTLSIPEFGVTSQILEPRGGVDTITFVADTSGVFTFSCGLPYNPDKLYCDPDHSMMTGTLIVLE